MSLTDWVSLDSSDEFDQEKDNMEPKPSLRPGAVLEFTFDDLPDTLHGMYCRKRVIPRLVAHLPRNYKRSGRYPLLVYLWGWDGGAADKKALAYVRKLTSERDFIAVNMPLFKKALDPTEIHNGVLVQAFDDYPIISRCYRKMLSALLRAVPNIDPDRSVIGGLSNGAHTTALLLSAVDPFILNHFSGFFLLEGGWDIASLHKQVVRSKRIIKFVGGNRRRTFRRAMLDRLDAAMKVRWPPTFTVVKMPGVEHDFPDAYIPRLREWMTATDLTR